MKFHVFEYERTESHSIFKRKKNGQNLSRIYNRLFSEEVEAAQNDKNINVNF